MVNCVKRRIEVQKDEDDRFTTIKILPNRFGGVEDRSLYTMVSSVCRLER